MVIIECVRCETTKIWSSLLGVSSMYLYLYPVAKTSTFAFISHFTIKQESKY